MSHAIGVDHIQSLLGSSSDCHSDVFWFSVCQAQQNWKQTLRRQCCLWSEFKHSLEIKKNPESWSKVGRTRSKKYWHLLLCQTTLWEMLSPIENWHERTERFSEGLQSVPRSVPHPPTTQSVLRNIQLVLLPLQHNYNIFGKLII